MLHTLISRCFIAGAFLLSVTAAQSARAATLGLNDEGLAIDGGSMGKFTLEYPTLIMPEGKEAPKVAGKTVTRESAAIKYDNGGQIDVTLKGNQVDLRFSGLNDIKNWKTQMQIGINYIQGGKWKVGNGELTPFPVSKPPKPHIFQGNAKDFTVQNFDGKSLTITAPEFSYLQLTDNREWNWAIFALTVFAPFNKDNPQATMTISDGATTGATDKPTTLVDQFGQLNIGDWPGKVKSLDEFKADVENEKAYYAGLTPPTRDKFGGMLGGREKLGLKATGFFHVEKKNDRWYLADPEGNPFFHLGLCVFGPGDDYTYIKGREASYAWIPEYDGALKTAYKSDQGRDVVSYHLANMIRKYGEPYDIEKYQGRMIDRVKKFGFNSIGAFSGATQAARDANFPYVASLPLDPWDGGIPRLPGIHETWDPFDEKIRARVEQNFAKGLPAKANDPLIIGYFLINEPLYEDIPKVVPTLKGTFACKRRLVQMLQEKYKTIEAFNTAWETTAKSFEELNDAHLIVKTKTASEDMHEYTGLFFETYFQLVDSTFRKYDKNHMLIGNRFQPGTINNEQLLRISGKYMDVISFNYYSYALDKDFLTRLHNWSGGKPMMLSEFYWTAPGEAGLAGGLEVDNQQTRGLAYRNYVEQAAATGFVVGIEWFTLVDQATTGRWFSGYNGERANSGIFSVTDRPWKPMVAEMSKTNYGIYDVWTGEKPPFVLEDPRFSPKGGGTKTTSAPRAVGPIKIDGTTQNWPGIPPEQISGKRVVQGSNAGGVEATFKLCWDEKNLYILASVIDPTPMKNENDGNMLWSGDGLEFFIGSEKIGEGGPLLFTDRQILLSAGVATGRSYLANAPQQTTIEMIVVPGVDGKSYTLEAAIPWQTLGIKPQVGQEFRFDLGLDDSADGKARARQLMWNGTDKNSTDRSHWGRLKLAP